MPEKNLNVRLEAVECDKFAEIARYYGMTRTELVRTFIATEYEKIHKEKMDRLLGKEKQKRVIFV